MNMHPVTREWVVATFYRFVPVVDPRALREQLAASSRVLDLRGTILVADEGLNATIAGTGASVDALLDELRRQQGFEDLQARRTRATAPPFRRMKVKLRREIVSMGINTIEPRRRSGAHVPPRDWHALLDDPRTALVDTRNNYEYRIGTFRGALKPDISHFRDFPAWVDANLSDDKQRPVAMFCTGGIRCEKASAYLLEQGFEQVYQLDGGILAYLEQVGRDDSYWQGDCFVFDERVAVDADLTPVPYEICPGCREPLNEADREQPGYELGVCCPRCYERLDDARKRAFRERFRQEQLAASRGGRHLGEDMREARARRAAQRAWQHERSRSGKAADRGSSDG